MKTKKLKVLMHLAVPLFIIGLTICVNHQAMAQQKGGVSLVPPKFEVDPFWPKPLPEGWVLGEPSATCFDSQDHLFITNRGWQTGGLESSEPITGIAAPPVIEFDPKGNIVNTWGDTTIGPLGENAVLPNGMHGCFVDYENNVWLAGNGDGIVQKYSHDGILLMQIGTKGICDGPNTGAVPYPTCAGVGYNSSHTLLMRPPQVVVDPNPDPVTGQVGSVYIADGYGNRRVVVFDKNGNFLRQWGSPGSGPGQFSIVHDIALSKEGWIYASDRQQNRIHVFDRLGNLLNTIYIDPDPSIYPRALLGPMRATCIAFSPDKKQTWMYVTDLGNGRVWIMNRLAGTIVGDIGRLGHMAGDFTYPHTLAVDSKGNLYVAETINGRRIQKFRNLGHHPED